MTQDALDMGGEGDGEAQETPNTPGHDFFIPKDWLGGKDCKPGDTITLTVTSAPDKEGDIAVKVAGYNHKDEAESEPEYEQDLRAAFGEKESEA